MPSITPLHCNIYLVSINDVGKLREILFEDVDIWNEKINNGRPSFVQSLVPDGRSEARAIQRLRVRNGILTF